MLYRVVRLIITPLFKMIFRPKYIGRNNIPRKGRIVLAGNHTNNLDSVLVLSSTKRTVHFLAKKELVDSNLGFIFKNLEIIPVDRKRKNKEALIEAENILNNDEVIGIFPEGTINRTEDVIMPFKMGAVSMASKTNTKILPFIISGEYGFLKKRVKIEFLSPYELESDNLEVENKKLENIISKNIIKSRSA